MTTMMSIGISIGIEGQRCFLIEGLRSDLKTTRMTAVETPMMKLPHVNSVRRENVSANED